MTGLVRTIALIAACTSLVACGSAATAGSPAAPTATPIIVASSPPVVASVAPSASAAAGLCGPIPASNGKDADLPWGEYRSGERSFSELVARLQATGLPDVTATLAAHHYDAVSAKTTTVTWCFVDGQWAQYEGFNGEAPSVGSFGTYTLTDAHTLRLSEGNYPTTVIKFKIDGDALSMTEWPPGTNNDAFDTLIQTGFTLFPYTRQP